MMQRASMVLLRTQASIIRSLRPCHIDMARAGEEETGFFRESCRCTADEVGKEMLSNSALVKFFLF
jgi:hypothetical protein